MANVKISGLAAGITPVAADLMEGEVAAGSSVKWTMANLWASMGFTSDKRLVLPAGALATPALQIGNRLAFDDGVSALQWNCNFILSRLAGNQTVLTLESDNTTATAGSGLVLRRMRSTAPPASADSLGLVGFAGNTTGTTFVTTASVDAIATEAFGAAAGGTDLYFRVTPAGSVTRAEMWRIKGNGQLTRGTGQTVQIDPDGGVTYPSYTAAQIAAVGNAINTTNKREGKTIRDSTNKRLMVADGALAASTWTVADGSVSVTPV